MNQFVSTEEDWEVNLSSDQDLICSFCGKSRFEVFHLVMGNDAFICDECIELCQEIINEKKNKVKFRY